MKELLQCISVARGLRGSGKSCAVATVVKIGGSAYRRPGARMLVDEDGNRWGTISGGCLEGEVAQRALQVIDDGRPALVPFELGEDDVVLGFGTGCDGIVHVLIEPGGEVFELIGRLFEDRTTALLATVIADDRGTDNPASLSGHHVVLPPPDAGLTESDSQSEHSLAAAVTRTIHDLTPVWQNVSLDFDGRTIEVLVEQVLPPVRLHIFGDGHDARAMINVASSIGWEVVVVGRKPVDELAGRFPNATGHVFLMHAAEVDLRFDDRCAAVVMNHNYTRDRELLRSLMAGTDAASLPYLGMLGPASRTDRMLGELENEGFVPTEEQRRRLFAPIGLDVGTETPEEIALATIAEIQAVLHDRGAEHLRDRIGPIHASHAAGEAPSTLPAASP